MRRRYIPIVRRRFLADGTTSTRVVGQIIAGRGGVSTRPETIEATKRMQKENEYGAAVLKAIQSGSTEPVKPEQYGLVQTDKGYKLAPGEDEGGRTGGGNNTLLYVGVGVAALAGIIYFARR